MRTEAEIVDRMDHMLDNTWTDDRFYRGVLHGLAFALGTARSPEEADAQPLREHLSSPPWLPENCPVCGEDYDRQSTGVIWPESLTPTECVSWVRVCTAPVPEEAAEALDDMDLSHGEVPVMYIHKDEHIDVLEGDTGQE